MRDSDRHSIRGPFPRLSAVEQSRSRRLLNMTLAVLIMVSGSVALSPVSAAAQRAPSSPLVSSGAGATSHVPSTGAADPEGRVKMRRPVTPSASVANAFEPFGGTSCTSSSSCMAVGTYWPIDGNSSGMADAWNGASWSTHDPTTYLGGGMFGVLACISANACTAVGVAAPSELAFGWNGSSWATESTPSLPAGGEFDGISCPSSTSCVAVGEDFGYHPQHPIAMAWNGTSWTLQTVPSPSDPNGILSLSLVASRAARPRLARRWVRIRMEIAVPPSHLLSSGAEVLGLCSRFPFLMARSTLRSAVYPAALPRPAQPSATIGATLRPTTRRSLTCGMAVRGRFNQVPTRQVQC